MSLARIAAVAVALGLAVFALPGPTSAQEREVRIAGVGVMSGILRSFGINSKAALEAAAEQINKAGGVKLGDGAKGKIVIDFLDDRCTPEEGISAVRRIASGNALVAIGPTCSNVAEPLFGILQKKAGDASDSGLQFPLFTDVAIKGGLAKLSEWAFRNVPDEAAMYGTLLKFIKQTRPELKTVYGGVEEDFAHSRSTWYNIIKEAAAKEGYEVLGQSKWLLADTNFTSQAREAGKANADIVVISGHPFSTCGFLKELDRQGLKPKLLIGLTSSSSLETLQSCGSEAETMIIPTSYAPLSPAAKAAADAVAKYKGSLDLHSAAAWENVFILKQIIEAQKVLAKPDTIKADREKIRAGLANLGETIGLLGLIRRTPDREADKPYLYVVAKAGQWVVVRSP
jgi:branched-chain amino acid transport system substrate-binding protein